VVEKKAPKSPPAILGLFVLLPVSLFLPFAFKDIAWGHRPSPETRLSAERCAYTTAHKL
jgi:hypothetical protein